MASPHAPVVDSSRSPASPPRVRMAEISAAPLSVDDAIVQVSGPSVGGIAIFLGVVRNRDEGRDVVSLDYTAHPTASTALRTSAERVAAAHDVTAIAVQHRIGRLEIGDVAVVVAVGAAHRGPALAACSELINDLKQSVPIWKEQQFGSGTTEWVGLS